MTMNIKRIGILSSGGDAPGINAVIRAVGKSAIFAHNIEVLGFRDGFRGITSKDYEVLRGSRLSNLLNLGGTILGSSRDKAFRKALQKNPEEVRLLRKAWDELQMDALICVGGNGTQKSAALLSSLGFPVIGIPKTIDNDIWGTEVTFGFDTAVSVATDLIDRIHSTAHSHKRVIIVEVMGHTAGWIALHAGMASGADIILLPELGCDLLEVAHCIRQRYEVGKNYAIIVVAEGLTFEGQGKNESPSSFLAQYLREKHQIDSRSTVLGYVQRGGAPSSFDRNICSQMGAYATELISKGVTGVMIAIQNGKLGYLPLAEVSNKLKLVTSEDPLLQQGLRMGVSFGFSVNNRQP